MSPSGQILLLLKLQPDFMKHGCCCRMSHQCCVTFCQQEHVPCYCRPPAAAANRLGISRLAASSGIINSNSNSGICLPAESGLTGSASSLTAATIGQQQQMTADGFDSHLSLGAGTLCQQQVYSDCDDFCIRRLAWDHSDIGLQDEAGCDYKLAAAGCSTAVVAEDSVDWFEQQLEQVSCKWIVAPLHD